MPPKYVTPEINASSFNCPRCGVLCPHTWYEVVKEPKDVKFKKLDLSTLSTGVISMPIFESGNIHFKPTAPWDLEFSVCNECRQYTIWHQKKIIFPKNSTDIPDATEDMPANAMEVYEEARLVFEHSPRAAAALLRLSIEMLLKYVLRSQKDTLNDLIEEMVKQDIPEHVQQSLDILRYFGNKGIHAGEINLNDDRSTVDFLFELSNAVVFELITRREKIESYYEGLPDRYKEQIEKRDKRN